MKVLMERKILIWVSNCEIVKLPEMEVLGLIMNVEILAMNASISGLEAEISHVGTQVLYLEG